MIGDHTSRLYSPTPQGTHLQLCLYSPTPQGTHLQLSQYSPTLRGTHLQLCLYSPTPQGTHLQLCLYSPTPHDTHLQLCLCLWHPQQLILLLPHHTGSRLRTAATAPLVPWRSRRGMPVASAWA